MKSKIKTRPRLKARIYPLLKETVGNGVRFGLHRAWKYREDPEPNENVLETIANEVIQQLSEAFDLSDD